MKLDCAALYRTFCLHHAFPDRMQPWHELPTEKRLAYEHVFQKAFDQGKAETQITGQTSDGYHTFDELYEHRHSLFIALCNEIDRRMPTGFIWRSKKHSDGSFIEGWFVMGIDTEPGKQITYHLPLARWDDTSFANTMKKAPAFDGHSSADVLARMRRFFGG